MGKAVADINAPPIRGDRETADALPNSWYVLDFYDT
jgi:hypothetical protein